MKQICGKWRVFVLWKCKRTWRWALMWQKILYILSFWNACFLNSAFHINWKARFCGPQKNRFLPFSTCLSCFSFIKKNRCKSHFMKYVRIFSIISEPFCQLLHCYFSLSSFYCVAEIFYKSYPLIWALSRTTILPEMLHFIVQIKLNSPYRRSPFIPGTKVCISKWVIGTEFNHCFSANLLR